MAKLDAGKIKEDAGKYLRRGKLDKALEAYQLLEKAEPNDLRVPQKIAELFLKVGQKDAALAKYYESAEKYHKRGFLVQAIAIYKVILENSPGDTKANETIRALTEERTGPGSLMAGAKPKPATAASAAPPAPTGPVAPEAAASAWRPRIPTPSSAPPAPGPKIAAPPRPAPVKEEPIAAAPEEDEPIAAASEEEEMPSADEASSSSAPGEIDLGGEGESGLDLELDSGGEAALELAGNAVAAGEVEETVEMEVELDGGEVEVEPTGYAEAASMEVVPLEEEEELPASGPERTPLFSDLSRGEFDRVFELLQSRVVEPGTVVVREGERGDSIFIVARGQARVSRRGGVGRDLEMAVLGPGDFFGEIGYFHGERRATVTAVKKMQLLEMSKSDLDEAVLEFPRVREVLVKFYRERVLENLLSDSPLFHNIPLGDLRAFRDQFDYHEFRPGQVIVNEGDPGDSMFLIKSGEVAVRTVHPVSGETVELAKLKGGDFFGEVSLIKNKPRTASVVALTPSEVMELSRASFQRIAGSYPHLGSALEQTIEQRVENTIKKMMETMES
jgi:CRP-like cAMP-binding protein